MNESSKLGTHQEFDYNSIGIISKSPSARKNSVKLQMAQNIAGESNRKFTHILSLYDKKAEQMSNFALESRQLEPKLSLKSRQDKPPSISKKASTTYNKNSYLTKVKEILTSRKGTGRISTLEDNRSPRSKRQVEMFSSMKEEDILKIYDMKSMEHSSLNTSGDGSKMKAVSRSSVIGTFGTISPIDKYKLRLTHQDEYSLHRNIKDSVEFDPFTRSSECNSIHEPEFKDPNLAAVVNMIKQSVSARDSTIGLLQQERDILKAELEACWRENDYLRSRLAKHQ